MRSVGPIIPPLNAGELFVASQIYGDLLYSIGSSGFSRLAAFGTPGYVLGSNGSAAAPSYQQPGVVADAVSTSSGTTINVNVDTTIYTVPSAPTNHSKFICSGILGIVTQALEAGSGSPNFALTVGKTAGGTGFLVSQSITTATAAGTRFGLKPVQLGTEFYANGAAPAATDEGNAVLAAGDLIIVRMAIANTGTISTQCVIRWTVTGFWI